MKTRGYMHGIALAATLAALTLTGGCATARSRDAQANPSEAPAPSVDAANATIGEELHRLMDAHQLTELRTTYNGTYGASMLFHADKVTYYVVLFQNKDFWRVIRTDAAGEAESVYRTFVGQTEQLAQVDIDAIRLQATKQYTAKLLSQNETRLQMLRQDIDRQHEQAQQVAARQAQTRQQAQSLTDELSSANTQLDSVRQNIHALEAQQANPSMLLPATTAVAEGAADKAAPTTTASAQP